jgi:hypothetical protein
MEYKLCKHGCTDYRGNVAATEMLVGRHVRQLRRGKGKAIPLQAWTGP